MIPRIVGETPNSLDRQKRFRDAEVGGSNPLSPTIKSGIFSDRFPIPCIKCRVRAGNKPSETYVFEEAIFIRVPKPWFRNQNKTWYVEIGGNQINLEPVMHLRSSSAAPGRVPRPSAKL